MSTKGSRLQRSNKNVLQRVEERHRRVLSEKANLAAFATHLRMQKKFKEAGVGNVIDIAFVAFVYA